MKLKHLILALILIALGTESFASNKISSPNITEDQMTLEYRGGYDFDDPAGRDGSQLHKFVGNYGITDRWRPEVKVLYLDPAKGDSKISGMEISLMYQIFKPNEAWAATSFESYYKPSFIPGISDRLEEKFLFEKTIDKFITTAYLTTEKEINEYARGGLTVTAAGKTKYKLTSYLEPGVEFYADLTRLDGEDRYQIGPIIAGNLTDNIKYEAGYLFGASDSTPEGRAKLIVSYSHKF